MKRKPISPILRPGLIVSAALLTLGLLASGCTSTGAVRMYRGPKLQPNQITLVRNPQRLEIIAVNVAAPPRIRPLPRKRTQVDSMEFLPGSHTITVVRDMPKDPYTGVHTVNRLAVRRHTLNFDALPGSVFEIGEDLQTSPTFSWKPWIREITPGRPSGLPGSLPTSGSVPATPAGS